MLRFVLLVVLAVLVWRGVSRTVAGWPGRGSAPPPRPRVETGEPLIPCDVCGVHVPRSRLLVHPHGLHGGVYCSETCRRTGVSGVV